MINYKRLKVIHITQGHPGNKQDNLNSYSGLTLNLCVRKTRVLKKANTVKNSKTDGEGREEQEEGTPPQTGSRPWSPAGHAWSGAGLVVRNRVWTALGLKSC